LDHQTTRRKQVKGKTGEKKEVEGKESIEGGEKGGGQMSWETNSSGRAVIGNGQRKGGMKMNTKKTNSKAMKTTSQVGTDKR